MRIVAHFVPAPFRRRLSHVRSSSFPPDSVACRPFHLITSGLAGSGGFAGSLPICRYDFLSISVQNRFFPSRQCFTSHDPCGRGTVMDDGDGWDVEWEEEEQKEPVIGDGGDGGGVVLRGVKWGEHALSLAREVLLSFDNDFALYAFKVSPKGYIYVRLDKLTNRYGCPDIDEIENFNNIYKKKIDEAGETGEIPTDMALEVSSPGAERLLQVPNDLKRFQGMAMWMCYLDESENSKHHRERIERVVVLESIDDGAEHCIFQLANVKENRAELGKGRPLSRKQKDWRLSLPFKSILSIKLYLHSRD